MIAWQALAIVSLLAYGWSQMDVLGDGFWYIATGRYVLAHRAFPPDELFSYSGVRGPWFVNMPISEPLFAWVTDHLGIRALLAMCTAVLGTALTVYWLPHSKGLRARLVTWPLVVFAIYVERGDLQARSQTLSYLGFAIVLLCMFRLRDGKHVSRWVPLLLGVVWVNVHPSFLLGVFVPVGFALALRVGPLDVRPALTPLLVFAALMALGGFVNPYGHRLLLEFLRFMTAESTTAIDLFQSPDFRLPEISLALLLGAGTVFWCLRSGSRQARYVTLLVLFDIVGIAVVYVRKKPNR